MLTKVWLPSCLWFLCSELYNYFTLLTTDSVSILLERSSRLNVTFALNYAITKTLTCESDELLLTGMKVFFYCKHNTNIKTQKLKLAIVMQPNRVFQHPNFWIDRNMAAICVECNWWITYAICTRDLLLQLVKM